MIVRQKAEEVRWYAKADNGGKETSIAFTKANRLTSVSITSTSIYLASSIPTKGSQKKTKTYSSRDSHVVTHRSTNLPFNCLCMAERTGCPVFS
ncbi:hypothetical protein KCU64_g2786, partial [Aureobasidium melanogenum]